MYTIKDSMLLIILYSFFSVIKTQMEKYSKYFCGICHSGGLPHIFVFIKTLFENIWKVKVEHLYIFHNANE